MTNFEAIRRAQILDIFTVRADAESGEWLSEPEATGEITNAWDWAQRKDTEAQHFDTYVYDHETQAERALVVCWA